MEQTLKHTIMTLVLTATVVLGAAKASAGLFVSPDTVKAVLNK